MLLKLLLKIWPSLAPIILYIFWVWLVKFLKKKNPKKDWIDAEKVVGEKSTADQVEDQKSEEKFGKFSLQNPCFVAVLYVSLILAIITLLVTAFY